MAADLTERRRRIAVRVRPGARRVRRAAVPQRFDRVDGRTAHRRPRRLLQHRSASAAATFVVVFVAVAFAVAVRYADMGVSAGGER
ncbi:hypothetical protein ACFQJD_08770 [Haloplanus sp. GCM10025708]|uniref:hypothetical protein n=1 Tax=Haloplanus sp. GCM10025708 TaxID=3252679 RepID=UPI0036179991